LVTFTPEFVVKGGLPVPATRSSGAAAAPVFVFVTCSDRSLMFAVRPVLSVAVFAVAPDLTEDQRLAVGRNPGAAERDEQRNGRDDEGRRRPPSMKPDSPLASLARGAATASRARDCGSNAYEARPQL